MGCEQSAELPRRRRVARQTMERSRDVVRRWQCAVPDQCSSQVRRGNTKKFEVRTQVNPDRYDLIARMLLKADSTENQRQNSTESTTQQRHDSLSFCTMESQQDDYEEEVIIIVPKPYDTTNDLETPLPDIPKQSPGGPLEECCWTDCPSDLEGHQPLEYWQTEAFGALVRTAHSVEPAATA